MWADPDGELGEANMLATHISRGLADGTFCNDDGDPLGVTVLFRRGTRMPEYEAAFAAEGLRVRTATDALFDCPAVETALAACEWLTAPGSPQRTSKLLTESPLNAAFDAARSSLGRGTSIGCSTTTRPPSGRNSGDPPRTRPTPRSERRLRPAPGERVRRGRNRGARAAGRSERVRRRHRSGSAGRQSGRARRDALRGEGDNSYSPSELVDLAEPFREDPGVGPTQPSAAGAAYDVEFRTIHRAKGTKTTSSSSLTPGSTSGRTVPTPGGSSRRDRSRGLAPPTNTEVPDDIAIPPFDGGLYGVGDDWDRDAGLRWATARWRDTVSTSVSDSASDSAKDSGSDSAKDSGSDSANDSAGSRRARRSGPAPPRRGERACRGVAAAVRGTDAGSGPPRCSATPRIWRKTGPGTGGSTRFATGWRSDAAAPTPTSCCSTRIRTGTRSRSASTTRICSLGVLVRLLGPGATRPLNPPRRRPARPVGPSIPEPQHNVPADGGCGSVRARPPAGRAAAHDDERGLRRSPSPIRSARPRGGGDVSSRRAHGTGRPRRRRTGDSNDGTGGAHGLRRGRERDPEPVGEAEREGMFAFFETVLDDFLDSDLWDRIADPATVVDTERPLDGLAEVGDLGVGSTDGRTSSWNIRPETGS